MNVNEQRIGAHEITVTDRARIVVSGVADVDCFNEEMIVLNTAAGALFDLILRFDHYSNEEVQVGRPGE